MLESYYVRPQAVDRIRASWIGSEIERYVGWLAEQSYSRASVRCRVPVLFAFGEFARAGGARSVGDLPAHVEAFVAERVPAHRAARARCRRRARARQERPWPDRADASPCCSRVHGKPPPAA